MTDKEQLRKTFNYCQETINSDNLLEIADKRQVVGYWGTAPTGRPHIAYLSGILNISRLVKAGVKMTVLIADYHATLDNNKTEWEALHSRTQYYTTIIRELLSLTGINPDDVRIVKGTDHQRGNPGYLDDLLRLSTTITVGIAKKATAKVVKCGDNPPLSNCIYPLMQVLDEEHLGVDFELGGVDQRKIFMFGIDYLPRIGYNRTRSYLMTPMIHSLSKDGKMSASESKGKIDLMDTPETIRSKCAMAYSVDGVVDNNGILDLFRYVVFEMPKFNEGVTIERDEKYGSNLIFSNYDELREAFIAKKVASIDLKRAMGEALVSILTPLREKILTEHPDLIKNGYSISTNT